MNSKCLQFSLLFFLLLSIGQINAKVAEPNGDICLDCMTSINNAIEQVENALLDIKVYLDAECANLHSNATTTCQHVARNLTNAMSAVFEENFNVSWICQAACKTNTIYSSSNLLLGDYFAFEKSLNKMEKTKNGAYEDCRKCLDTAVKARNKVVDMLKKCREIMLNACQKIDEIFFPHCEKVATEVSWKMITQFESRFQSYPICLPVCKN